MNIVDGLQWPAMVVTVAASWFIASPSESRRSVGFYLFMLSNVLWIAWGLSAHAYALVVLQLALAAMNIRGVVKAKRVAAAAVKAAG